MVRDPYGMQVDRLSEKQDFPEGSSESSSVALPQISGDTSFFTVKRVQVNKRNIKKVKKYKKVFDELYGHSEKVEKTSVKLVTQPPEQPAKEDEPLIQAVS